MSPQVKVVLIDDSALMRKILSDILERDPEIHVLARGKNGKEAIQLVREHDPDVLILDYMLPDTNGIEILKKLRRERAIPTILMSALTQEEIGEGIELLMKSSSVEFIEKGKASILDRMNQISETFIEIVKGLAQLKNRHRFSSLLKERKPFTSHVYQEKTRWEETISGHHKPIMPIHPQERGKTNRKAIGLTLPNRSMQSHKLIVIGASTGGPKAISTLLSKFPKYYPPIIIVQHMPNGFTQTFAERLNQKILMHVKEAEDKEIIKPNTVYIAKAGYHLELKQLGPNSVSLNLVDGPMVNHVKPSVDVTLESAARIYGKNLISVILTGMGRDGTDGCRIVKKYQGIVIAEDESTCTIFGMPKAVIESNLADYVLPLHQIPYQIDQAVGE